MLNAGFGLHRRDATTQTEPPAVFGTTADPVLDPLRTPAGPAGPGHFSGQAVPLAPEPVTGSLTLVVTSHPTSAFSPALENDVRRKVGRNREHRYDRLEQVRAKYARYLQKRIAYLARVKSGDADWNPHFEGLRHGLGGAAVERLQAASAAGGFPAPGVRLEASRTLRQIENVIVAAYRMAAAAGPAASLNQLKTWTCRDNDRSSLVFGDHSHMFAAQVESACKVYRALLDLPETRLPAVPRTELDGLLQRCIEVAARLRDLIEQAAPAELPEALARFFGQPENALQPLEDRMLAICATLPDDPFSQVFRQCRIAGFAGEARINAVGLNDEADAVDRQRISEVLLEMRLVARSYPDTRSIVIAEFSRLEQVAALQRMLEGQPAGIEVIPLLETPADIACFVAGAARFKAAGVRTVMLAGSDLVRVAGTPLAIVLRHRLNQACVDHGLVAYHGIGTSARRNGIGMTGDTLLADSHARLFQPAAPGSPQEYRYTLQGGDAMAALGNPALARQSLEKRLVAIPRSTAPPVASPSAAQVDEAASVFAPVTAHEMAMRRDDGDFADFYRAHRVILAMRNSSVHHGSRDGVKPGLRHLYQDRAINADASIELFNLTATFAWGDLAADPSAMQRMVRATCEALQAGNPVVHDILLNYGLQAATIFSREQCFDKWRAAGFAPVAIERLAASRAAMLAFLDAVGHGLEQQPVLQRYLLEYLGIGDEATATATQACHRLPAIVEQRRRCNLAGIAALCALRQRDDPANPPAHREIAALELHLQLSAAYVHGLGVKS